MSFRENELPGSLRGPATETRPNVTQENTQALRSYGEALIASIVEDCRTAHGYSHEEAENLTDTLNLYFPQDLSPEALLSRILNSAAVEHINQRFERRLGTPIDRAKGQWTLRMIAGVPGETIADKIDHVRREMEEADQPAIVTFSNAPCQICKDGYIQIQHLTAPQEGTDASQ